MNIRSGRFHLLSCLLPVVFLSCSKPNDPPSPPVPTQSSVKAITSFVFKTSNNPGLTSDVNGIIGQDTIKLMFPFGASITNLIPLITITGKSVNPQSNTPQDFTNAVSYTVTAEDGTTKKYVVVASLQPLQGTIFVNSFNGSVSPLSTDKGYVYAIDANTGNLRWKYAGSGFGFLVTPAFLNGILYTSDRDKVIAIDTATKALKWEFQAGGILQSALAIANGIVYTNCDDGFLYALDAATGTLKWKFAQDIDPDNTTGSSSSPTITNSTVYFGSGRSKYVYAVDATNGSLKWKWFNSVSQAEFQSGPSVVNGILYIGDVNGNMIALDAGSGDIKWSFSTHDYSSSPTIADGILYFETSRAIYALDALTGTLKWQHFYNLILHGSPAVAKGVVYFTTGGGNSSFLYAVDAKTGSEKWSYWYDLSDSQSPVVFNDIVYFTIDFNLFAIEATTGKLKWMFATTSQHEETTGAPCVVDQKGNVFYSSVSGLQN
jgi:outer membrane protein assembly factor BamB